MELGGTTSGTAVPAGPNQPPRFLPPTARPHRLRATVLPVSSRRSGAGRQHPPAKSFSLALIQSPPFGCGPEHPLSNAVSRARGPGRLTVADQLSATTRPQSAFHLHDPSTSIRQWSDATRCTSRSHSRTIPRSHWSISAARPPTPPRPSTQAGTAFNTVGTRWGLFSDRPRGTLAVAGKLCASARSQRSLDLHESLTSSPARIEPARLASQGFNTGKYPLAPVF